MSARIESAFEALTLAIKKNDDTSVREIDRNLGAISKETDPNTIAPLLLSLDDSFSFDEGMFSVIHTAENFDDSSYIAGFLTAIPHLVDTAPKWSSIILMRIFNSDETNTELLQKLLNSPQITKKKIAYLCDLINLESTDFLNKTVAVIMATK